MHHKGSLNQYRECLCLESRFEIRAAGLEGRENQTVTGEAGSHRLLRTDFPCFFPTHDQQLRTVSLKSAVRAGLRYGKWQTLQIRASCPVPTSHPRRPVAKHLPALG